MAQAALAAQERIATGDTNPAHRGRIALARFFADQVAAQAAGLAHAVATAADAQEGAELALAS
jgi:butyryl-CoA dehydrogenase